MAKRNLQPQEESLEDDQNQTRGGNKLQQAQEKLARMEETNKICFRHRMDFARIEAELQKFNYSKSELDHILEPKGPKNIPGYSYSEMESQRQYVKRFTSRNEPGESHAADVDQSRAQGDERER